MQLLRPSDDHESLEVTEHLARLFESPVADAKIAVVSVVGPYHSGKSFLLNSLIGRTDIFSVGPKTAPQTLGVWLCRTDRKTRDGSEIWLLDSEGFYGPRVSDSYDAKIFTLASLLSSSLVYNSIKVIDQQAVNSLEMLARQAQLFSVKTSDDQPDVLKNFPKLTWVVEDFVQEETKSDGDSLNRWVRSYLSESADPFLLRVFPDFQVQTLFLPATAKSQLRDLSQLSWEELTPEFRSEISRLRINLFDSLVPKSSISTARQFGNSVHFLVAGLRRGLFPTLPSLWNAWQTQISEASLKDATAVFARSISSTGGSDAAFDAMVAQARSRAHDFYSQLVRDFGNATDFKNLESALRGKHQEAWERWQAAARAAVEAAARNASHAFSQKLTDHLNPLPASPQEISRSIDAFSREVIDKFSDTISAYSSSGASALPLEWPRAALPLPSPGPLANLRVELASIGDLLVAESTRRAAGAVELAAAAALRHAEEATAARGEQLLGSAELREWGNSVKLAALSVFERELLPRWAWMEITESFMQGKKLVETETESRLNRFRLAHQTRLADWFRKTGDRLVGEYREVKRQMELTALPSEEGKLADDHNKIKAAVFEKLDEMAGRTADTAQFVEAKEKINTAMRMEWERLRSKNVELWKVHSDEATQCGLELNKQYRALNCWNGWICLFQMVPQYHKSKSQEHLDECFERSSRMPVSMRHAVFESWYEKDLSRESSEVYKNLFITFLTCALPLIWFAVKAFFKTHQF